jgi:ubiquinone/menaquinone biosynthesis C-methylase UbiE
VGEQGASRLRLLNRIYGPHSEQLLLRAGLRPGLRVADVGCGVGIMACWLAGQVGPAGSVVGVDASAEQLEKARATAQAHGLANVTFVEGSAYDLGHLAGGFDVVYARLILMHLARPVDALAQMRALLKPGGVLVCEETEVESSFCHPPSEAHARLQALSIGFAKRFDYDFNVGRRLYSLVREAGFANAEVSQHQPVYVRGEEKRFEALSFDEVAGRIAEAGFTSTAEVAEIAESLRKIGEDESVVYSLSRMTQVWARR